MKILENKKKYLLFFKKQLVISICVFIVFLWCFTSLLVKKISAYHSDTLRYNNIFSAGILNSKIVLEDSNVIYFNEPKIIKILNKGGLSFEYSLKFDFIDDSDIDFCSQLEVLVIKDSNVLFEGNLNDLNFVKLAVGNGDELIFNIKNNNISDSSVCFFNLNLKAWQNKLNYNIGFNNINLVKIEARPVESIVDQVAKNLISNSLENKEIINKEDFYEKNSLLSDINLIENIPIIIEDKEESKEIFEDISFFEKINEEIIKFTDSNDLNKSDKFLLEINNKTKENIIK